METGSQSYKSQACGRGKILRLSEVLLSLVVAMGSVTTFYAHALIDRPAEEITPFITILVAASLLFSAVLGLLTLGVAKPRVPIQKLSRVLLIMSVGVQIISCVRGLTDRSFSLKDAGIVTIQVVTPIMLMFSAGREQIVNLLFKTCVVFAFLDLVANLVTFLEIFPLVAISGGGGSDYGVHYLGLSGSSLAEGAVAFFAILYVSSGFATTKSRAETFFRLAVVGLLFFSEFLMRARSYTAISLVAFFLLAIPRRFKIPLGVVCASISVLLLYGTFFHNPYHTDESLRASLMRRGVSLLPNSIIFGDGGNYRVTADLVANVAALETAGITESETIDLALSYGCLALILLYASIFTTLDSGRSYRTRSSVLLTCLAGSLVLNSGMTSFLGSIMIYASLLLCQEKSVSVSR